MTTQPTSYAVITLTNTTNISLDVKVSIDGQEYFVVTLGPDESTSQLSPTGAAWTLAETGQASSSAGTTGGMVLSEPDDDGKPTEITRG